MRCLAKHRGQCSTLSQSARGVIVKPQRGQLKRPSLTELEVTAIPALTPVAPRPRLAREGARPAGPLDAQRYELERLWRHLRERVRQPT